MTSRNNDNDHLVVLSGGSTEHDYAKQPSPPAPLPILSAHVDLADLLGIDTEDAFAGQENGLVPTGDLTMSNDWLGSMYEPAQLATETCVPADSSRSQPTADLRKRAFTDDQFLPAPPAYESLQTASGLTTDPLMSSCDSPMTCFMHDLEASLSREKGQLDSDLATWLADMMKEAPPSKAAAFRQQPVFSHGSPSSDTADPGYDSHGSVSSPGSASGVSLPAASSVEASHFAATSEDVLLSCAEKLSPRAAGRSSVPKLTFEELERITLSGPTAFSSPSQVCWQPGVFKLTADELEVLEAEHLPIPAGLPLSVAEEKALKYVRRKIKNKIAAQESRRKKKSYVEGLEKRVLVCTTTNSKLQQRVKSLEDENKTLLQQLKELQEQVAMSFSDVQTVPAKQEPAVFASPPLPPLPPRNAVSGSRSSMRTGLFVLAVCFMLILPFTPNHHLFSVYPRATVAKPTAMPQQAAATPYDYTVTKFQSRVLLHTPELANSLSSPPVEDAALPSSATPAGEPFHPTLAPPVLEQSSTEKVRRDVGHPEHVRL